MMKSFEALEVFESFPYHIVDRADFFDGKVIITFKSGNQLEATSPNREKYDAFKNEMIKNLGEEKVGIL